MRENMSDEGLQISHQQEVRKTSICNYEYLLVAKIKSTADKNVCVSLLWP